MSDALAPCPFCGDSISCYLEDDDPDSGAVMCVTCGADGPRAASCDDATAAWNRRPTPPPTDDGGAAMAEAMDALIAAVGGEYPGDRETAARARVLALHATAVAEAEARGRLDPRGVAAGYAYSAGHEDALRDVAEIVANYGDDLDDFYERVESLVAHLWPLSQADAAALAPAEQEADDDDA